MTECDIPPEGWKCTREGGHEGPCAAVAKEFKYVPDEIRKEVAMSMRTVYLHDRTIVKSTMAVKRHGYVDSVIGELYVIDDDDVRGYLPSRVWYHGNDACFRMSYYTNSTLSANARPFKDGKTYVFVYCPQGDEVVQYPEDWRVFIEHVVCPDSRGTGVAYVFIFGEDMYDEIIAEGQ